MKAYLTTDQNGDENISIGTKPYWDDNCQWWESNTMYSVHKGFIAEVTGKIQRPNDEPIEIEINSINK